METVMSNSSKVLVDIEGGNNMMYLPLDKLVSQSAASSRAASAEPDLAGKIAREVLDQLRREQSRTTRSEGR